MASEQILVNVSYRSIPLFADAVLTSEEGGRGFLKTDSPMPVGTALTLSPVENQELQVSARVARVVEACRGAEKVENESAGMSVVFEAGSLLAFPSSATPAAPVAPAPQAARPAPVSPAIAAAPTFQDDVHEESDIPTVVEHPISVQLPPPEQPSPPTAVSGEVMGAGPVVAQVEVLPSGAKVVIGPELYDERADLGAEPAEARMVVEEPEDADAPDKLVYEIEADYAPPAAAAPVAGTPSPEAALVAPDSAASVAEPAEQEAAAAQPAPSQAAQTPAPAQEIEAAEPPSAPIDPAAVAAQVSPPAAEAAPVDEESSSDEAASSDDKDEGDEKKKGKRKGRRRRRK